MSAPHSGKSGRPSAFWLGVVALVVAVAGLAISFRPTSLAWGPLSGAYGEEVYQSHRFRWLDSTAEIAIWAPRAETVAVEGEWRCAYHLSATTLDLIVNGSPLSSVQLGSENRHITWPSVPLKSGQNVLRFVSSAGHAQISPEDPRAVAVGVQDLQVHHRESILHLEDFWFFLGVALLGFMGWRLATRTGLRHVDALGAGMVGAFGALSLSATTFSLFHSLTGVTWIIGLMVIAAGCRWSKQIPCAADNGASFKGWQLLVLLLPALLVGVVQVLSPVIKFDDLMYHGSRAGYWLGNQSVFPFPSHNERQEVFPYPGDLLFAFGVFTAHNEALGRIMVFLAYPGVLLLTAGLLLKRGVAPSIAIGTAWVVGVAPRMREAAIGIKPDLWGLVFTLVAINAAWNIWREPVAPDRKANGVILLGAICAAMAIKLTFLLLLPLALIPLIFAVSIKERAQYVLAGAGWLIVFGLALTVIHNRLHEGGWLGSPAMTLTHQPDPGVGAPTRHLERLPFLIVSIPWVPNETLRRHLEEKVTALAAFTGAATPLPAENNQGWPGSFTVRVPEFNRGYSLLWLAIVAGAVAGMVNLKNLGADRDGWAAIATLGLGLVLTIGVVVGVRWQSSSDIPERFLVPGLAVLVIAAAWCWDRLGFRHILVQIALALFLFVHAIPFLHDSWLFTLQLKNGGMATGRADSVLSPAAAVVPPGSRVLLFASQSSGDYVLFHPEVGFPTRVFPWGRQPFSEKAFASALAQANPDFIVFESADSVGFHWHPSLGLAPFIHSLDQSKLFSREPGGTPNLIYRRNGYTP